MIKENVVKSKFEIQMSPKKNVKRKNYQYPILSFELCAREGDKEEDYLIKSDNILFFVFLAQLTVSIFH